MMGSKHTRLEKREELYNGVSIDTLIERLKKVRALNCNPSYIGMDNYLYKKLFASRSGLLTKAL